MGIRKGKTKWIKQSIIKIEPSKEKVGLGEIKRFRFRKPGTMLSIYSTTPWMVRVLQYFTSESFTDPTYQIPNLLPFVVFGTVIRLPYERVVVNLN